MSPDFGREKRSFYSMWLAQLCRWGIDIFCQYSLELPAGNVDYLAINKLSPVELSSSLQMRGFINQEFTLVRRIA